ncbi:MAG TPA: nitroreductase family protein [Candidatus Paceibacterota bacterium]|jgi:nitroreductase|nr:nitroreductase family protein [Candidatus Paceibacterota bacterium]
MKTINNRTTEYPIDDIFLKRYSPRAMSGESITKEELMTLFEAAHWAPSASNIQPWRFIYAMRDTPEFEKLFSLLIDFNKDWCVRASVLIVTISYKNKKDGALSPTHSFDTGSAWENFALQASTMNLIAHGMAGFDYDRAKTELNIPDDYNVEMMIAVGKHGKVEDLPEPLREREAPSDRKPLQEIVFEGKFPS